MTLDRGRVVRVGTALGALLVVAGAGGCAADGPPRSRLGSIPFPGLFTLYETADAEHLGQHHYQSWWGRMGGAWETDRGIMYTCRAGFLDLSHIREYSDWVRYVHDRARAALAAPRAETAGRTEGPSTFSFTWSDARYEVTITRPAWLDGLPADRREAVIDEAAIRIGQRMSIIIGTWHEAGTWWGQETIPPVSEKTSAFTWDDTTSHVVAAILGGRALRDPSVPWDDAATRELSTLLAELGVVSLAREHEAVMAVHGRWWKNGIAVRRDLDTGLQAGFKRGWLAPGVAGCEGVEEAAMLPVPGLEDVLGYDLRGAFAWRVRPEAGVLKRALGGDTSRSEIEGDAELLAVLERLRAELREEYGADADGP